MIEMVVIIDGGEEYASILSSTKEKCIKYGSRYIEQALTDCTDNVSIKFVEEMAS